MSRPILNEGDRAILPDGRVITFLEFKHGHIPDDICGGCIFQFEDCGPMYDHTGPCGTDRPDGKLGIFVECKKQEV